MSTTVEQPKAARRPRALRPGPVVLATHGNDGTDAPLTTAARFAKRLQEPLRVVTVVEPMPVYGIGDVALPMFVDEVQRANLEADVHRAMGDAGIGRDAWSLHTLFGSVARSIAAAARQYEASLIVLAAHPHHRPWSTVAGERAAQVLRSADCPVLSVAPQWNGMIRRPLVAVDFASPSIRAAQIALELTEAGGTLTLLHVRPLTDPGHIDEMNTAFERLLAVLRTDAPEGVAVESRVARGLVVERVLECAQEIDADLIAIGTHGPTILERIFVGSSAAGVLHGAECSVLASPPPPIGVDVFLQRAMGTVAADKPGAWATLLDGITTRNAGRLVTIEIDDPSLGAQVQGAGLVFRGAAYDHHDGRVEVMLDDKPPGGGHLTRTIGHVDSIGLLVEPGGRDQAIQIRSGVASTLVRFGP